MIVARPGRKRKEVEKTAASAFDKWKKGERGGFCVGGRLARGEANEIWHRTSKMKVPRTGPQSQARERRRDRIGVLSCHL